jgi:hypothetical protein
MRNLLQYPLTRDEVLNWIDKRQEAHDRSEAIGSMEPVILNALEDLVRDLTEEAFVERFRIKPPPKD